MRKAFVKLFALDSTLVAEWEADVNDDLPGVYVVGDLRIFRYDRNDWSGRDKMDRTSIYHEVVHRRVVV